tara:strand:- start:14694 stop:15110 length:417 start_codon:yes stop_codon:yes gene_type:complete
MKQSELKNILKPLVKQCIKEVIFEEGVLSGIISEVVRGTNVNVDAEQEQPRRLEEELQEKKEFEEKSRIKLQETRKKMLDAVGKDSYNGVDLFENTDPMRTAGAPGQGKAASPLEHYAPNDSGIDISGIVSSKWKQMV